MNSFAPYSTHTEDNINASAATWAYQPHQPGNVMYQGQAQMSSPIRAPGQQHVSIPLENSLTDSVHSPLPSPPPPPLPQQQPRQLSCQQHGVDITGPYVAGFFVGYVAWVFGFFIYCYGKKGNRIKALRRGVLMGFIASTFSVAILIISVVFYLRSRWRRYY